MVRLVLILFTILTSYCKADSCSSFSTTGIIREIKALGLSSYDSKRLTFELKTSRGAIRDKTQEIKKQRIRVKRVLIHELSSPANLESAFNELSRLELRLLYLKYQQLKRIRELLRPDQRQRLNQLIKRYY